MYLGNGTERTSSVCRNAKETLWKKDCGNAKRQLITEVQRGNVKVRSGNERSTLRLLDILKMHRIVELHTKTTSTVCKGKRDRKICKGKRDRKVCKGKMGW